MASRRSYAVTDSSPNSPGRSYLSISGTDSPSFYSTRSLSPDIETIVREEDVSRENEPLIARENHYENGQAELSMCIAFPSGSSNSLEAEEVSFWKHIR